MATKQTWVETTRAEALTTVFLTRRADFDVITVARYERNPDYDFLVQVNRPELPIKPEFGVVANGTRMPLDGVRPPVNVRHTPPEAQISVIPVCLFVFNVESEEGVFRWLLEPFEDESGRSTLRSNTDAQPSETVSRNGSDNHFASYEPLDNDAVDRIVQRVIDWTVAKNQLNIARSLNRSAG